MKTIYFIRHAKSDQKTGCPDMERTLSERGEKNAVFMANRLKKYSALPDIIISSPAKRAFMTAKIISDILDIKSIETEQKLYMTSVKTYLDAIHKIDDNHNAIFIVGHNPIITSVCEELSGFSFGNMPTCGIFCIDFDVESFADISKNSGKKRFFNFPKKHAM